MDNEGIPLAFELTEIRDDQELSELLKELKKYGSGDGQSFYSLRMSERAIRLSDLAEAKKWVDLALRETPNLPFPYFLQVRIAIRQRDFPGAQRALAKMQNLIHSNEGEGAKSWLIFYQRAEFERLVAMRDYRSAFNLVEKMSEHVPINVIQDLRSELAISIQYDPKFREPDLRDWSAKYQTTFHYTK